MATNLWKIGQNKPKICSNLCGFVRYGHHLRGKPPGVAKCLQERLDESSYKDPKLHYKVNIGYALPKLDRNYVAKERHEILKRNQAELEKSARKRTLIIDLDEVKEGWTQHDGLKHIKTIADHYGIFNDLFGDAYFYPVKPLNILYSDLPVCYGNLIKPSEAKEKPHVKFESDENSLWTLIMTNPDGHLTENDKEYVHWFVGNIPGNNIDRGETIVDYLQPFPPKGTGYHRHVFLLYRQESRIDYSEFKKVGKCLTLSERTFSNLSFYKNRQDELTPAGFVFFQSDWDSTLQNFYHKTLGMKEPIFEYDFPKTYIKPQAWFPLREAFNLYMDRYRDPKQINKEFLVRKLKNVHPFKPPVKPIPFPNALPYDRYIPTWLKLEMRKSDNKWGRINDI